MAVEEDKENKAEPEETGLPEKEDMDEAQDAVAAVADSQDQDEIEEGRTVVAPLPTRTQVSEGMVISNTYKIRRAIGKGGMARVFEAEHLASGTRHAVKIAHADLAEDPDYVDLFKREVGLLRRVRHDGVVGYDGLLLDEAGTMYLIMEYIEGPSLEAVLQDGPLSADAVRQMARCLTAALGAAHDKGVVHRDLSPDNIILRNGNLDDAVIIDFGIARDSDAGAKTVIGDRFAGKLNFAAPEQFGLNDWTVDRRADIYSLGLVLAAAAKGDPVDMGTTISAAVQRRMETPDLSDLPADLKPALTKMLNPDPDDRPSTMAEAGKLFDDPAPAPDGGGGEEGTTQILPMESPHHERPTTGGPTGTTGLFDDLEPAAGSKPERKLPMTAIGIGAAAVCIVLVAGSYLMFSGSDAPDDTTFGAGETEQSGSGTAVTPSPPVAPVRQGLALPLSGASCQELLEMDGVPSSVKAAVRRTCTALETLGGRHDLGGGALIAPNLTVLEDGAPAVVGLSFGAESRGYVYVDVLDDSGVMHHVVHGRQVSEIAGNRVRGEPFALSFDKQDIPSDLFNMMSEAMKLDLSAGGPVLVTVMISERPILERRVGFTSQYGAYMEKLRAAAPAGGAVRYSLNLLASSAGSNSQ